MINNIDKKAIEPRPSTCVGCGSCVHSCKYGCIEMRQNDEGFFIANVDTNTCRSCGSCIRTCPFEQGLNLQSPLAAYAFRLSDVDELVNSSSGGAFYALASSFIEAGGYVCAATDNCNGLGRFILSGHLDDVKAMRKSKYYYIDLDTEVIESLRRVTKDNIVLFCGLPCQVHAVKHAVGRNENLVTVDLLCQGAPSGIVLNSYRRQEERRHKSKLVSHSFRSKRYGVDKGYVAELVFESGDIERAKNDLNPYTCSFAHKLFLREACYNCPFSRQERVGDISIGDFWGLSSFIDGSPDKEVSLVLLNSIVAQSLIEKMNDKGVIELRSIEEAAAGNAPLNGPCKRPIVRSISYPLLKCVGFRAATSICYPKYLIKKLVYRGGND